MGQTNFRQWNEQPTEMFDEKWQTGMCVEFGQEDRPEYGIIRLNMGTCLSILVACGSGGEERPKRDVHVIITPNIRILEHDGSKLSDKLKYCRHDQHYEDSNELTISHTIEKRIETYPLEAKSY